MKFAEKKMKFDDTARLEFCFKYPNLIGMLLHKAETPAEKRKVIDRHLQAEVEAKQEKK